MMESVELFTSTSVYGFFILHRNLLSKSFLFTAEKCSSAVNRRTHDDKKNLICSYQSPDFITPSLRPREHISGTAHPIFTNFYITYCRGSVLLRWRCDMLCASVAVKSLFISCSLLASPVLGHYMQAWHHP